MKLARTLLLGSAAAMLLSTGANAVTFNLIDTGGTEEGTQARQGFEIAAAYWSAVLTNNSTVNLEIGFEALGPGILGSTGSSKADVTLTTAVNAMNATGNSALDATALQTVNSRVSNGSINAITSGPRTSNGLGVDTNVLEYDNDGSENNRYIYGNTATLKAIGLTNGEGPYPGGTDSFENIVDGGVTFSNSFNWDFNPSDGVTAGSYDFIGVAIHEIGHALGFVSGVDLYDFYGFPNGPQRVNGNTIDFDNPGGGLMSTLDLFRFSEDVNDVAPGDGPVLDWSVARAATIAAGGNPFFSIDGENQLFGDSRFSTGAYNGDGRQASHFKDSASCTEQLGIMDPTFCNSIVGTVTGLDLAAFDAMGWNLNLDILANPGYQITTGTIYELYGPDANPVVPEPASWAMMIAGFGLVGGAMRRRNAKLAIA